MFRVKDLVISVVPKEAVDIQRCLLGTHICIRPTVLCPTFVSCPRLSCALFTPCPNLNSLCGIVSPCGPFSPCGPYSPCGHFSPCGPLSPCGHFSPCGHLSPCGHFSPHCPLHSVACVFGTRPGCGAAGSIFEIDQDTPVNPVVRVINEVSDIKALRQELDEVQKRLAQFEETGLDVQTDSPEDLATLETKLKEALDDVQARRKSGANKK